MWLNYETVYDEKGTQLALGGGDEMRTALGKWIVNTMEAGSRAQNVHGSCIIIIFEG